MSSPRSTTSQIVYYPPSPEILDHFAFSVCQELGPGFDEPDVARDFASAMATVAQIQANNLNRKAQDDFTLHVE